MSICDVPIISEPTAEAKPATPSTMSKQLDVFIEKFSKTREDLVDGYCYSAKMGGSNGCLSGLRLVYPNHNWEQLLTEFLREVFGIRLLGAGGSLRRCGCGGRGRREFPADEAHQHDRANERGHAAAPVFLH